MRHETRDANGTLDERQKDLASHVSCLAPFTSLRFTLKAWPVIAVATIGLCFLTQTVAGWFGVTLPEQNQTEVVRAFLMRAFESSQMFVASVLLVVQVLVVAPVAEELIFRLGLFKGCSRFVAWAVRKATDRDVMRPAVIVLAALSAIIFSTAHYPDFQTLFKTGTFRWLPLSNAFLALVFFGLAQCWLYRKTDHIWCAILNHVLFNLTNLVLLFIIPQG